MSGIIVGVDGSDHSTRALHWAMLEAVVRHLPLTVMSVRSASVRPATEAFWPAPIYPDNNDDLELARAAVGQLVAKVAGDIGETAPDVLVCVLRGDPARELLRESSDAELLVVGSRGSGGFATLVMGSVSSKVAHHATCAVAVIPSPGQEVRHDQDNR
jgi:nucleotide-binding universal stress UspA family protein